MLSRRPVTSHRTSELISSRVGKSQTDGGCFLCTNPYRVDPKKNPIIQEYVLPDLTKSKQGHVRQPDEIAVDGQQVLTMNNERFAVPELLFRPDDIGTPGSGS